MRLRTYTQEDFEALYAIEELCFEDPFRFSRRYMKKLLEASNSAAWIADTDKAMAGFAILEWNSELYGTNAYIVTLEVAPAFRRRGIGASLLAQCEDHATRIGASILWLHVATENVSAIRLYEAHGFKYIDREEDFYAIGRGAQVHAKKLRVLPLN